LRGIGLFLPGGTVFVLFAALAAVGEGPCVELTVVVARAEHAAVAGRDAVQDHMNMRMRLVIVRNDDRLPILRTECADRFLGRAQHFGPADAAGFFRVPGDRIGVDRCGRLAARGFHAGLGLQPILVHRRGRHDLPRKLGIVGGKVAGFRPCHAI